MKEKQRHLILIEHMTNYLINLRETKINQSKEEFHNCIAMIPVALIQTSIRLAVAKNDSYSL